MSESEINCIVPKKVDIYEFTDVFFAMITVKIWLRKLGLDIVDLKIDASFLGLCILGFSDIDDKLGQPFHQRSHYGGSIGPQLKC